MKSGLQVWNQRVLERWRERHLSIGVYCEHSQWLCAWVCNISATLFAVLFKTTAPFDIDEGDRKEKAANNSFNGQEQ